jgi:hypothetical protein
MSWSDVDIELLVHACQARSPTTTSGFPVWLWSDFLQMPPHLEAVRRVLHLKAPPPRFEIVELNMTNVRRYVSDLPAAAEAIAAQSPAAMSDAVRAALLAQHGGLWVDTDILVAHELSAWLLPVLESHDIASYAVNKGQKDHHVFSSNLVAARRCRPLWLLTWEVVKASMQRPCENAARSMACCSSPAPASPTDNPALRQRCRVPWASLGEAVSHPIARALSSRGTLRMFLWSELEGFAPSCMPATMAFNVYTQRLGHCSAARDAATILWNYSLPAARAFEPLPFNGSACCRHVGPALECLRVRKGRGGVLTASNPTFFRRHACARPALPTQCPCAGSRAPRSAPFIALGVAFLILP